MKFKKVVTIKFNLVGLNIVFGMLWGTLCMGLYLKWNDMM